MPVNSIFLRNQLEYVTKEVVKQDYPEMLMASGQILDVSDEIPSGAETYSYRIFTFVGSAAILANGADDIPLVNAYMEKRTGVVRTVVDGYAYTVEDLEAADFAGTNLDAELATGAREVIERQVDLIGYEGDSNFQLYGWLNYPNIPTYTVLADGNQNGGTNSTRFQHKTADQVYRDLTRFASATRTQTRGAFSPQAIAMSQSEFEIINSLVYPANTNSTLLEFFLRTQRATAAGVQSVFPVPYLEGKGAGNTGVMTSFRKRKEYVKFHIPKDFTQERPQVVNFNFKVPCRMRTGGVELRKPLSMRKADGI